MEDSKYIYKNELDKACFQYDMACGEFKDLPRRTIANKILHDEVFNIAKNLNYDRYWCGLTLIVYKFFHQKTSNTNKWTEANSENKQELHKPIIKKCEKRNVHSFFINIIFGVADLADIQLLNKFDKRIRFLLCVIDIFSKYAWVVPLKYKNSITITDAL